MDRLILGLDRALRTLTGQHTAARPSPTEQPDNPADGDAALAGANAASESTEVATTMTKAQRRHAAGLMRVNHCGEVCAQALYEGQALTASGADTRELLEAACAEEIDHLVWCEQRLAQLDARPSMLNPLFYAGSWGLGVVTGLLGDRTSLGFVEATEHQVVAHLDRHLDELPAADTASRAVLTQMRADEARHGEQALDAGGAEFGGLGKTVMGVVARVMTVTTYRI